MANLSTNGWDDAVPDCVATLCKEFEKRVGCADPVSGKWSINTADSAAWTVWCDASDTAMGVVLDVDGVVVEDKAWLRPSDDKRHINIAELDAVIKGLNLASHWGLQRLVVKTDSKTAHSWLVSMLQDVERVKVGGLYELLVRRRVQIIQEIVEVAGMEVIVAWVPSAENRADELTRVPATWLACAKTLKKAEVPGGASVALVMPSQGPLSSTVIKESQQEDKTMQQAMASQLKDDARMPDEYRHMQSQLQVADGILMRSVKVPPNEMVVVPLSSQASWRWH